jgi:formylglycine-generating enzyme required for sulfatase activity
MVAAAGRVGRAERAPPAGRAAERATFSQQAAAAETSKELSSNEGLLAVWRKKKTLAMAIGLGLLGVAAIIALAVTIRVRHPGGKETSVTVPNGSDVTVNEKGEVDVAVSSSPLSPRGRGVGGEGSPHPNPLPKGEGTGVPPLAKPTMLAIEAAQIQTQWAEHLGVPVEESNSIGMKLVLIPPGEFEMGSTPEEIASAFAEGKKNNESQWYLDRLAAEAPRHRVKITKPFYMAASLLSGYKSNSDNWLELGVFSFG